jgi:hypothetical protein
MEQWKIIPFLDDYEISTKGEVRKISNGYIKKQWIHNTGYFCVNIKDYPYRVHRLMGLIWLDYPTGKGDWTINHKDSDKLNNKIENLEWLTRQDNLNHYRNIKGFRSSPKRIECWKNGVKVKEYEYLYEVEKDGFRKSNVSDVIRGRGKTVKGYSFIGIW